MIFFVAMPLRDRADELSSSPCRSARATCPFPFLNNFSFWMTTAGADAGHGLAVRRRACAQTGWLAYPPLSGLSPTAPASGVDYYIWSLQIAGIGTTLSGINLIATIVKMRAPGMTMMRMPIFTWTALCTNVLIVASFPVLTAVLALLSPRSLRRHQFLHQRSSAAAR